MHYQRLYHGGGIGSAAPKKAPNGGSRIDKASGYRVFNKKAEHIIVAEKALGKPLPVGAVVHHMDENKLNNTPSNLVICQDAKYHNLIHQRMRAYDACGHADWLKCVYCKQYDAPENLHVKTCRHQGHHRACEATYKREKRHG